MTTGPDGSGMDDVELGDASATPGELDRGYLTVADLPTGSPERLPVVVVNGSRAGPTLWITGAIHGDEATGMAVAHDAVEAIDPEDLSGQVVCVPTLNPAGLRRNERRSYYHDEDPNRTFPDPESDRHEPRSLQELIATRVYEALVDSADLLLDLHTAGAGSMPFVIRDRVLYGQRRDRPEAEALAANLDAVARATGLPVVTEYEGETYTGRELQRSTAGATLNAAGTPALTLELGSHGVVEESGRRAGLAAVLNVAVERGLLDTFPGQVGVTTDEPPSAPVEYPVKRHLGPRTDEPGICRFRVQAGDPVEAGEVVAEVRTPTGELKRTVESEFDGYLLGRREGTAVYENGALASFAVRDDGKTVVPRDPEE
jgi:predicted deacylase